MADSYISVDRYIGASFVAEGEVSIGVNNEDTVKYLDQTAAIAEGSLATVTGGTRSDYQNTSEFGAVAVLTLQAVDTGAASRHVRIYSSATAATAGTLLWEVGEADTPFFDAASDLLTTPPLLIQNNRYLVIENVDDSRAGTNSVRVLGQTGASSVYNLVVERGA